MVSAYSEGEIVKIKAVSADGYGLDCSRDDNVEVSAPAVSNGFHTFTLSGITKDVVATVKYKSFHTVRFDMNGQKVTAPADIKVANNETFTASPTPMTANYVFQYWCTDADGTTPYDFSKGVTSDITLYAKWAGSINGLEFVELAGYKWATKNVSYCSDVTAVAGLNKAYNDWKCYFYSQEIASSAAKSWGSEGDYCWTLPSEEQWLALIKGCDWTWTTQDNKTGYKVSDKNDSSKFIFLPAAGIYHNNESYPDEVSAQGGGGFYWSNTNNFFSISISIRWVL